MRVVLSRLVHFRWFFWCCVVLLTIATSIFYFVVRGWFLNQSATYTSVISDITVNFILLFFLIGVSVDVIGKQRKWSRTKWNVVLVVVLMVVILLFRLLGFRTRFG